MHLAMNVDLQLTVNAQWMMMILRNNIIQPKQQCGYVVMCTTQELAYQVCVCVPSCCYRKLIIFCIHIVKFYFCLGNVINFFFML
jgi:hypothetical protein